MNIEFNKEDFEACLEFARIQRWLEDDLHRKLYLVMVVEAHKKDPGNQAKSMMVSIAKNLNPESFVSALQDTRKLPGGKEFCTNIYRSIELLDAMVRSMSTEDLEEFIKEKEESLGVDIRDARVPLEKLRDFILKENNYKYFLKLTQNSLKKTNHTLALNAIAAVKSIPALTNQELLDNLRSGYEGTSDVWEMVVEVIEGVIKIRGGEDVTDDELKHLGDYGFGEDDD